MRRHEGVLALSHWGWGWRWQSPVQGWVGLVIGQVLPRALPGHQTVLLSLSPVPARGPSPPHPFSGVRLLPPDGLLICCLTPGLEGTQPKQMQQGGRRAWAQPQEQGRNARAWCAELSPQTTRKRPGGEMALEETSDPKRGSQWVWVPWALTALGEMATCPGSAVSLHLWDPWAPDTMSPWTVAPISVPAISKVIPGTQRGGR